jgi:Integrase core domain
VLGQSQSSDTSSSVRFHGDGVDEGGRRQHAERGQHRRVVSTIRERVNGDGCVGVTAHPTAAWMAQPLRNAFPESEAPRYLLHDRDSVFAHVATTLEGMNIQERRTVPRSPWQNAYVERVIGSIRRECLDHVIVVNASGRRRVLTEYVVYHMRSRSHLGLARTRRVRARSHRRQPVALSPFRKSAACITATTASQHNRSRRVPPTATPAAPPRYMG